MDPEAPDQDARLRPALEALAEADPALGRAYRACGLPPVRRADPGFAGIVGIVASQQLSKDAAGAILRRIRQRLDPVTPAGFLALDAAEASALGLSRPKVRYLRGVAEAVLAGELDFAALQAADDATVLQRLTALKGIGTWTAEIYLLFALERPDVFPAQDLALQVSAQRIHALDSRPDAKTLRTLAETWRPYRSAAAKFLWHAYRHPGAAV